MQNYLLEREQIIHRPRSETFAFFCDAFNLGRITPPFLRFRILTRPPITMAVGALICYRLKLFGVPFRWLTAIDEWSPEESFVDTQIRGPYWLWRHTHTFEEIDSRRALMRDRAEYRLLYGAMGRISHALFIRRTLDRIFDYRADMIARLLAPDDQSNVIQFPIKSSSLPEHPEVA